MNTPWRDSRYTGSSVALDATAKEPKTGTRPVSPAAIEPVFTGGIHLTSGSRALKSSYRSARPFPHVVLDDLFNEDLLERVVHEMPPRSGANWVHHDDDQIRQFTLRSALDLGEAGGQLVAFLHSAKFLHFLSEMTGIRELLPDPYLQGAGYHLIPRGGKFDVHVDRNTAYSTGLTRRLSLLIYLNKHWKREYGGQLELWSKGGTRSEVVIEPTFNRTVIFEISDENYHGVPSVVRCPEGRSRDCFVAYYHTVEAPGNGTLIPHTSIYAPSRYRQRSSKLRQFAKDLTPPFMLRILRRLAHRD